MMLSSRSCPDEAANEPPGPQGLRRVPLQTVSSMPKAADVGRHLKTEQRAIISKDVKHKRHSFMMLG